MRLESWVKRSPQADKTKDTCAKSCAVSGTAVCSEVVGELSKEKPDTPEPGAAGGFTLFEKSMPEGFGSEAGAAEWAHRHGTTGDAERFSSATCAESNSIATGSGFVLSEMIEKVFSTTAMSWSCVGMRVIEKTVMLLKNGYAFEDLTVPPGEIEIPDSIESGATGWTTWRQDEDGLIYLARGDHETRLQGEEIDLTPLRAEEVYGIHTAQHTEVYGATSVTTWSDLRFKPDGRFEISESVLTTTGGAGSVIWDTFTSTFYEPTEVGHLSGTYTLLDDGLTVELSFTNGDVFRELLYRGSESLYFRSRSYRGADRTPDDERSLTGKSLGAHNAWLALLADTVVEEAKQRTVYTGNEKN